MKYFILKPLNVGIDRQLVEKIQSINKAAEFSDTLEDCDVVVLQSGWSKSVIATKLYNQAQVLHKKIKEGLDLRAVPCIKRY